MTQLNKMSFMHSIIQPSADVEKVIHCKDCEYFCYDMFCCCPDWNEGGWEFERRPHDFCSYGKKKVRTMKIKMKLDREAIMPTRAHETDAGLDLYATEEKTIPAHGSAVFDTGIHVELPSGTVGMLKSKSGLNVKHDLTGEGVIDAGYTGSIHVKMYNHGERPYTVGRGDKIIQLVVMPIIIPEWELVDDLDRTERGNNGFGSTGR